MRKKILWVVTARSGSKSIPNKNIKLLGKYPLLAYRVRSALYSVHLNDLWISTDSVYYAEIAKMYGATIPFIRPKELSTDEASSIDVVLHTMQFANSLGLEYEYIGLLEPTSPFTTSKQLDEAITQLENYSKAEAIVAVKESRPNKIFVQKHDKFLSVLAEKLITIKNVERQSFEKEITPSGGFYISKWNNFLDHKSFYTSNTLSFEVDEIAGLEIDEPIDWLFADFIIEKNLFDVEKLFNNNGSKV